MKRKTKANFLVKVIGIVFITVGLVFVYFAYYPFTEKVQFLDGVIVSEYERWPNVLSSLTTPSFLDRNTPLSPGHFHIIIRGQDNGLIDLNYFSSYPSGKLSNLDKSQTYSIKYNPNNNRIYQMWVISKINGRKVNVGPNTYGSNSQNFLSMIIYGLLGTILIITGILLFIEKNLNHSK